MRPTTLDWMLAWVTKPRATLRFMLLSTPLPRPLVVFLSPLAGIRLG